MSQHKALPDQVSAPRIGGVCERDVDLLLLEEFLSNQEFRIWFLGRIGLAHVDAASLLAANRSVTQYAGESDLELLFGAPGRSTAILIENKVGAQLQPLQAERYTTRGEAYLVTGACAAYHTVIIAPAVYFQDAVQQKGFQHRLTYEDLIGWFAQAAELGERGRYKATLLRAAASKGHLGYEPIADAGVTEFFQQYWAFVAERHPELGMRKPGGRPSGSGRVYFKTPELDAVDADVAHKTGRGIVDLHLRGRGHQLALVQAAIGPRLDPDMTLEAAGKSAAVRLRVPVVDRTLPLGNQLPEMEACVSAAKRLFDWAERHLDVIGPAVPSKQRRRARS